MPDPSGKFTAFPAFLEPAPFAVLKRQVEGLTKLSREEKGAILSISVMAAIETVSFDEDWYLSAYLDVQAAIDKGGFTSGLHHYGLVGFFECRFPTDIKVDDEFYVETYPDVKQAVALGTLPSGKIHFLTKGYKEGRIPSYTYRFSRQNTLVAMKSVRNRVTTDLSGEV